MREPNLAKQVTGEAGVKRRHTCPEEGCDEKFWRVYDVRRHLRVIHHLALEDVEVKRLLAVIGEGV